MPRPPLPGRGRQGPAGARQEVCSKPLSADSTGGVDSSPQRLLRDRPTEFWEALDRRPLELSRVARGHRSEPDCQLQEDSIHGGPQSELGSQLQESDNPEGEIDARPAGFERELDSRSRMGSMPTPSMSSSSRCVDASRALEELQLHVASEVKRVLGLLEEHRPQTVSLDLAREQKMEGCSSSGLGSDVVSFRGGGTAPSSMCVESAVPAGLLPPLPSLPPPPQQRGLSPVPGDSQHHPQVAGPSSDQDAVGPHFPSVGSSVGTLVHEESQGQRPHEGQADTDCAIAEEAVRPHFPATSSSVRSTSAWREDRNQAIASRLATHDQQVQTVPDVTDDIPQEVPQNALPKIDVSLEVPTSPKVRDELPHDLQPKMDVPLQVTERTRTVTPSLATPLEEDPDPERHRFGSKEQDRDRGFMTMLLEQSHSFGRSLIATPTVEENASLTAGSMSPKQMKAQQASREMEAWREEIRQELVRKHNKTSQNSKNLSMSAPLVWSNSWSEQDLKALAEEREQLDAVQPGGTMFRSRVLLHRGSEDRVETNSRMERLVKSPQFEGFWVGCVIANCLLIGVETQWMATNILEPEPRSFKYLQYAFSFLFVIEIVMRVKGIGCHNFFCGSSWVWAWLDVVIIVSSLAEMLLDVLPEIMKDDGVNATSIRTIRVIRLARFIRTLRMQRLIRLVSSLRTLVYSIAVTLKSLVWALVLMTIIMYMVGVALTQVVVDHMIAEGTDVWDRGLGRFWRSLDVSMFTLFQAISGGVSWADAAEPLGRVSIVLVWVLASYIAFTYFAVLNVVTGVFCHSAIDSAERNPDVVAQAILNNQKLYMKNIEKLFHSMDQDNSKCITFKEMERIIADPENRAFLAAMEIEAMDAWTLFRLLDHDRDGVVEMDEFVDGCLRLKGNAKNVEIANLTYGLDRLDRKLGRYMKCLVECRDLLKDGRVKDELGTKSSDTARGSLLSRGVRASDKADPGPRLIDRGKSVSLH